MSEPIMEFNGILLDLGMGIGNQASVPDNAPDQHCFHPQNSKYQLDPPTFKGVQSAYDIGAICKASCSGCTMFLHETGNVKKNIYQL